MKKNVCKVFFLFILLVSIHSVRSEYVEGTESIDANGWGLDSAFQVTDWCIRGDIYVSYNFFSQSSTGYYNFTFDEIQTAPDTTYYKAYEVSLTTCCFMVRKNNQYYKIQLVDRSTFRYGTNTSPNDRILVKSDYDRSIRYNVNNLFFTRPYCGGGSLNCGGEWLYWDPPLPNNNHLRGYILYVIDRPESFTSIIDTTKPVDSVIWDSVAFFPPTTTKAECSGKMPFCGSFNMVALYDEGKSDLLSNWTLIDEGRLSIRKVGAETGFTSNAFTIKNTETALIIDFSGLADKSGAPKLDLYTLAGRLIASLSINKTYTHWSIPKKILPSEICVAHFTTTTGDLYTKTIYYMR
jgi:hypothetical protein